MRCSICCVWSTGLLAQASPQQFWLTYNQQARLSNKWGYLVDLNHRTSDFEEFNAIVSAARAGGTYYISESFRISAGYAWFGTYTQKAEKQLLNEHRAWQQLQWLKKINRSNFMHRIRLEERFREAFVNGETTVRYSTRLRYMAQLQWPIIASTATHPFALYAQGADELMLHAGEGIGTHYFDQNRVLAGLAIQPNKKLEVAALYQLITQYQPSQQTHSNVHGIRLTILHQLDFRRGAE
ncbi:MAG TPA: DUF2490 domain-containing protein [Phnomibacter sp.]|nr:DUF2490 domain-containing protein [Phnomibacter sp.]